MVTCAVYVVCYVKMCVFLRYILLIYYAERKNKRMCKPCLCSLTTRHMYALQIEIYLFPFPGNVNCRPLWFSFLLWISFRYEDIEPKRKGKIEQQHVKLTYNVILQFINSYLFHFILCKYRFIVNVVVVDGVVFRRKTTLTT